MIRWFGLLTNRKMAVSSAVEGLETFRGNYPTRPTNILETNVQIVPSAGTLGFFGGLVGGWTALVFFNGEEPGFGLFLGGRGAAEPLLIFYGGKKGVDFCSVLEAGENVRLTQAERSHL